ncbi:hypothetical protein BU23DRAFT_562587 [Bimuria novae-zelandiae CBS 107.79]|uniref:Uncharacterized protein n=1 Tax=Bimuria novae-zelandiae CBS 107.79 TaxID=1447943 RepID=A0A6A5VTF1_9PLEO|nr:hypothetical protein BU23DRAFT_562587 [Bimuria novae-zelandiae CBS 107.79]
MYMAVGGAKIPEPETLIKAGSLLTDFEFGPQDDGHCSPPPSPPLTESGTTLGDGRDRPNSSAADGMYRRRSGPRFRDRRSSARRFRKSTPDPLGAALQDVAPTRLASLQRQYGRRAHLPDGVQQVTQRSGSPSNVPRPGVNARYSANGFHAKLEPAHSRLPRANGLGHGARSVAVVCESGFRAASLATASSWCCPCARTGV